MTDLALALKPRTTPAPSSVDGAQAPAGAYRGPDRRRAAAASPATTALIDEIDYGIVVVDALQRVLHANRAARSRLRSPCALVLDEGRLECLDVEDAARVEAGVQAAANRGLRRLVTVGHKGAATTLSIVPLPRLPNGAASVLLMVSREHVCEPLSAQCFARAHGLTLAESRVLQALCDGARPVQIAAQLEVALSTVRTHIGTLRGKTGAASISDLVHRVARLPPMVSAIGT
jgi:DNA-binding CsgD family transcriptional regulator